MPEMSRFGTRANAGHMCLLCGFVPTTKNKYRELQDHLVRQHFRDKIKAVLPTKRPYVCPQKACKVEGKDWQALMRHYTGKHGVLDIYLKEALSGRTVLPDVIPVSHPATPIKDPMIEPIDQTPIPEIMQHHPTPISHPAELSHPHQQQQQLDQQTQVTLSNIVTVSPTQEAPPQMLRPNRRKRPSHNSTGSSSSPESLTEDELEPLIIKQAKPEDLMQPEHNYTFVDLKYFLPATSRVESLLAIAINPSDLQRTRAVEPKDDFILELIDSSEEPRDSVHSDAALPDLTFTTAAQSCAQPAPSTSYVQIAKPVPSNTCSVLYTTPSTPITASTASAVPKSSAVQSIIQVRPQMVVAQPGALKVVVEDAKCIPVGAEFEIKELDFSMF